MATDPDALVTEPSPNEMRDPEVRRELKRAAVWLGSFAGCSRGVWQEWRSKAW